MSYADARRAIEVRFQTMWAATPYAATRVVYEDTAFDPKEGEAFLALSIYGLNAAQAEIRPGGINRYEGSIQIDASLPSETGTRQAATLLDAAAPIFRRQQFELGNSGLITCRVPSEPVFRDSYGRSIGSIRIQYYRDIAE